MKPDPDKLNLERAQWAEAAVRTFRAETRADDCDALADLLCDLMHLCDARAPADGWQFDAALERARAYYVDETADNAA